MRAPVVLVLALLIVSLAAPPPAAAQDEPLVAMELVAQPVWHRTGDDLNIRIKVTNQSESDLEGFSLALSANDKVRTRSELDVVSDPAAFEGLVSLPSPLDFPDVTLAPGEERVIEIDNPVTDLSIVASGEPGVYPLKIRLFDGSSSPPLAALATPLLYYPDTPETRLRFVPVLPLSEVPARDPAGVFAADEGGDISLAEAIAHEGWLTGIVDALELAPGTELAVAPTPRMLEELADMADGYQRAGPGGPESVGPDSDLARRAAEVLARLEAALTNGATQTLLVPYASPDLPSIAHQPDAISRQLDAGQAVVEDDLGIDIDTDWVLPPDARLDEDSFEQLRYAGVQHSFFGPESLVPPDNPELAGCPVAEFSFACPVHIETALAGPLSGFALDQGVQEHLADLVTPGDARLDLQRFFAETAMIREELPGNADRILPAVFPATWHPRPATARLLMRALNQAPWLDSTTPQGALEGSEPDEKTVRREADPVPDQPDDVYFDAIAEADVAVQRFRSINPPLELIERLAHNVMVAQSRLWWADPDRGLDYALESEEEVSRELEKIRIVGPQEITLTSKNGELQFLVINETGYEVTVDLELSSTQLELSDVEPQVVSGRSQRISLNVTTQASGIFPIGVQLRTPDGMEIGEPLPIVVRSTEFNEIALGVTFGALAFLVLFYFIRWFRRRGGSQPDPGATPA